MPLLVPEYRAIAPQIVDLPWRKHEMNDSSTIYAGHVHAALPALVYREPDAPLGFVAAVGAAQHAT